MNIQQLRALERIEVNAQAFGRLVEQTLVVDAELVGNGVLLNQVTAVQKVLDYIMREARALQAHVIEGKTQTEVTP